MTTLQVTTGILVRACQYTIHERFTTSSGSDGFPETQLCRPERVRLRNANPTTDAVKPESCKHAFDSRILSWRTTRTRQDPCQCNGEAHDHSMLSQNQKMKSTPYRQNLNSQHYTQAAAAAAAAALRESSPRDGALTPPTQRIILDQLLDSPAKAVNNVAYGLYNV